MEKSRIIDFIQECPRLVLRTKIRGFPDYVPLKSLGMSEPQATPPTSRQVDTRSLTNAAGLIGAATFFSRILGFIRDMVLAQLFGASATADAFMLPIAFPIYSENSSLKDRCPQPLSQYLRNIIQHVQNRRLGNLLAPPLQPF
ncbi:MAG: hypothetical protein ACPGYT_08715 [Nitrospirales bacterium]